MKLFKFLQHLPKAMAIDLQNTIIAQWTHHSTALEGNSFSFAETDFFLKEGLTIAGKTIEDHQEILFHAQAVNFINDFIDSNSAVDETFLFQLHKTLFSDKIIDVYAPIGAWKNTENGTYTQDKSGQTVYKKYPLPNKIPSLMSEWNSAFAKISSMDITHTNASNVFAYIHTTFVNIHPFCDGNGRMARLLGNIPLLKSGLPPVIITKENRYEYINVLKRHQANIQNDIFNDSSEIFHEIKNFCEIERKKIISLIDKHVGKTITVINSDTNNYDID